MSVDSPMIRYAAPLVAGVATIGTLATIGPVFSHQRWLLTSVVVVAVIVGAGMALRALGVAQAYVSLIQLLVGCYALLLLTGQQTMIAGFIPTGSSVSQLLSLIGDGAHTARTKVAPITPTAGTAALLALLVIPVCVLVDDCAVTGRPALAGIPLLTLFAISAAIVRHPISIWLVLAPVAAFLLLLWLGEYATDGRRRAAAGLGGMAASGLIALIAMAIAAAATVVVRLPDGGVFAVAGNKDRSPNETVARSTDLVGQLTRKDPLPLFSVTTDDPSPFYLRAVVLESWGKQGWSFTNTKDSGVSLDAIPQGVSPAATARTTSTITIDKYSDVFVPTYFSASKVSLPGALYDSAMSVAFTDDKGKVTGTTYEVVSEVPRPTSEELAAVTQTASSLPVTVRRDLVVPGDVDPAVIALTEQLTAGASSPWQVAVALDTFFNDPAQGWVYSLEVPDPAGQDPLASFLTQRRGFCEQYASAMAGMFRIAGVPARVVIGYTKGTPQADGSYSITTDDAHAWVETYFDGIGWVSFDPTPIGSRAVPLPYVPSDQITPSEPTPSTPAEPSEAELPSAPAEPTADPTPPPTADAGGDAGSDYLLDLARWALVALFAVALLTIPGQLRHRRWRSRLAHTAAGGRSGAFAAWAELRELTSDLGIAAAPTLSESAQARRWADDLGVRRNQFAKLGELAERARYSDEENLPAADRELRQLRSSVRDEVGPRRWWSAMALPAAVRRMWRRG